jgi:hypothetical protein
MGFGKGRQIVVEIVGERHSPAMEPRLHGDRRAAISQRPAEGRHSRIVEARVIGFDPIPPEFAAAEMVGQGVGDFGLATGLGDDAQVVGANFSRAEEPDHATGRGRVLDVPGGEPDEATGIFDRDDRKARPRAERAARLAVTTPPGEQPGRAPERESGSERTPGLFVGPKRIEVGNGVHGENGHISVSLTPGGGQTTARRQSTSFRRCRRSARAIVTTRPIARSP